METATDLKSEVVANRSQLADRAWAVVGQHYLNYPLTHDQAVAEARDLLDRKQTVTVITLEAARTLIEKAVGVGVSSMPDMKF